MKKPVAFTFETLGQLPMQDAVVGVAKTQDGAERVFVAVLTEGLSANKRKEKLSKARAELDTSIINQTGTAGLSELFSDANTEQTQAKITNAASAGSLVQYMLSETEKPIVILNCEDKASFWQSLRSLRVDHDTLFALAELEHLKPEHISTKQTKPAGQAHLLCESLAKGRHKLSEFTKPKELIERIKKAHKVKIPAIDIRHHISIAAANRGADLKENPEPMTILGDNVKPLHAVRKVRENFRKFIGLKPKEKTLSPAQTEKLHKRAAMFLLRQTNGKKHTAIMRLYLAKKITRAEFVVQQEALKAEFKEEKKRIQNNDVAISDERSDHLKAKADELLEYEGLDGLFTINRLESTDLNIRDGYHFLRHSDCLFEFAAIDRDTPMTVFVLASQQDRDIEMQFFMRGDETGIVAELDDKIGQVLLDENMQIQRWSVYDPDSGAQLASGKSDSVNDLRKNTSYLATGYLGHIMDVTARMNDPDYEIVKIEPTGGKARQGKFVFPYFDYEVVETPLERSQVIRMSPNGGDQSRSSPIFHAVARHVRTYHRDTPDEYVRIIDEHHRGDPSKGVKGKQTVITDDRPSADL